jgi:hypothetical protein
VAKTFEEASREILSKLDLIAEFKALGVRFCSENPAPRPSGWVECYAAGRDDDSRPSAAIHAKTGRYIDKGGQGESLSFWDFATRHKPFTDWLSARRHYADKAMVSLGKGRSPNSESSIDKIEFVDWTEAYRRVAEEVWCGRAKPGIEFKSLPLLGMRVAKYPKKTRNFTVLAAPVFGPALLAGPPVAHVLWEIKGNPLPVWDKFGNVTQHVKMKSLGPTKGLMGLHGCTALSILSEKPEVVWKTAGPTDLMGLLSVIPESLLEKNQHVAICNAGGEAENVTDEIASLLAGQTVYLVHDRDDAGEVGLDKWRKALLAVGAWVKVVRLPYPHTTSHGKDLRDYLAEGHSYADLLAIAEATPWASMADPDFRETAEGMRLGSPTERPMVHPACVRQPVKLAEGEPPRIPPETDPEFTRESVICRRIGLDVLGESEGGEIYAFSQYHRKLLKINKIGALSYPELLQACGPPVRTHVIQASDDGGTGFGGAGLIPFQTVKEAIALLAGRERRSIRGVLGIGVWQAMNDHGDLMDSILLVGSREGAEYTPGTGDTGAKSGAFGSFVKLTHPRHGRRWLGISDGEPWYDFDELHELIRKCDHDEAMRTFADAERLFARWRWRNKDAEPTLLVGLVMATFVQTVWKFRPQVAVTGETNTGKSVLYDALRSIFGSLASMQAKSSTAGIRQSVEYTARAILLDEFEKSKYRNEILEMMRCGTRGIEIHLGSPKQEGSKAYLIQHIFWIAAIESGLRAAPDVNRFILCELIPPTAEKANLLEIPSTDELRTLGQRLLAAAIRYVIPAKAMASRLKKVKHYGIDARVVESYSIPCAMIAAAVGFDDDQAVGLMTQVLKNVPQEMQRSSDQHTLIESILDSHVEIGGGRRVSAGKLLEFVARGTGALDEIEKAINDLDNHGLRIDWMSTTDRKSPPALVISPQTVRRHLLKFADTPYENLREILKRIPGSLVGRRRVCGGRPYCNVIPLDYVTKHHFSDVPEDYEVREADLGKADTTTPPAVIEAATEAAANATPPDPVAEQRREHWDKTEMAYRMKQGPMAAAATAEGWPPKPQRSLEFD